MSSSAPKKHSGARISYKKGGLDIGAEYHVADVAALSAIVLGGAGFFFPEPISTIAGSVLITGGMGYFGVKTLFPQVEVADTIAGYLPGAKENPATNEVVVLQAAAGLGLAYYLWSQHKKSQDITAAFETTMDEPAAAPVRSIPVTPSAPLYPPLTHVIRPVNDLASGRAAPSEDTNLWWWPLDKPKGEVVAKTNTNRWGPRPAADYGETDSWIAWATGAEEGEGYIPDDWWVVGTKKKAGSAASGVVTTAAEAAGSGVAKAIDPIVPDGPLLPSWLLPTVVVGTFGLGTYWIYNK